MDTYDSTLSTAERDRRERVSETVASVAMKLRAANRLAQECKDDVPVDLALFCDAVCDAAAQIDNAVGDVAAAATSIEGGRYANAWDGGRAEAAGIAAMNDLNKTLTGGR